MLSRLIIDNIALIEHTELNLNNGLNILSGETGAGKSIIIDSLYFALGARADKSLIRHGSVKAGVEAVFEELNEGVIQTMSELGFEDEGILILNRTMTEAKQECRVNGRVVTLSMLKSITTKLVDILGQNGHQILLDNQTHLPLLDKYGEKNIAPKKGAYQKLYEEYKETKRLIKQHGDSDKRVERLEYINSCLDELKAAALVSGEEEELKAKREIFNHSGRILESLGTAFSLLDNDEGGVLPCLSGVLTELRFPSSIDPKLAALQQRVDSCRIELKDITDTVHDYVSSFDFDERSAHEVEERYDLLSRLKKKYRVIDIDELSSKYEELKQEYDDLLSIDHKMNNIEKMRVELLKKLYACARDLSDERRRAAKSFEKSIISNLTTLGMKNATFSVAFSEFPSQSELEGVMGDEGVDIAEYLISPNAGEPLKPLTKIISGGENSRLMLAMKNITSKLDGITTLVFDEIDTGISGNIAEVVAKKLFDISEDRQVIAITHLPQLTSMADTHYLIEKQEKEGKTHTSVYALDYDDSIKEIARLIGGSGYSDLALPHARRMKEWGDNYKKKI